MRALKFLCAVSVLALTCCTETIEKASAESIGVNFTHSNGATGAMASTDSAGLIAQTNWNNASSITESPSPSYGSLSNLTDSTGSATDTSISWSGHDTWNIGNSSIVDSTMMNAYLDAGGTPISITVTNVPYATYDVYAYVGSDGNGRVGHGLINGLTDTARYYTVAGLTSYVEATATTVDASASANYIHFSGVTGSSFTYAQAWDKEYFSGLCGLQIVSAVPEPSAMILLGSALIGLLCYAWRKRR